VLQLKRKYEKAATATAVAEAQVAIVQSFFFHIFRVVR
jgi:hypothetical protein